jgi:hypothetical protein
MTSAAGGLEKGNSYTIKLKQLSAVSVQYSAPPLVFGMLHTIERRDTMLMDYRSADIHGLGPRSGATGGDLTGGDKPRPYVLMFHSEELIMIASWY